MRFAVIGKAQAGKSTFAEFLAEYLGLKTANTSDWLIEVETFRRKRLHGLGVLEGSDFHKQKDRAWLIALGDAVCAVQPDFLIEQALKRGGVITGVRRKEEFDELPNDVVVIYIDRAETVSDNFNIPPECADHVVKNTGTIDDLRLRAQEIATGFLQDMAQRIMK